MSVKPKMNAKFEKWYYDLISNELSRAYNNPLNMPVDGDMRRAMEMGWQAAIQSLEVTPELRRLAIDAHLAARDAVVSDFPMGAIENGRAFAERLENTDLSCIAGDLHLCVDWHEFRRCFEHLANWALTESLASRKVK